MVFQTNCRPTNDDRFCEDVKSESEGIVEEGEGTVFQTYCRPTVLWWSGDVHGLSQLGK